ncbi:unnamed protein product [Candida verbasci]|uniref:DUF1748-domain-containing protein n=1 Tax=Candida verbasci TaxID=1227364 RepID=A0A9W4TUE0_9ASCO|nr:unnamed protein product [Candida verbasci]
MFGKITHYAIDLVMVSIILASVHRNTGLVFDVSHFSSIDVRNWFGQYLSFGETCYDKLIIILRISGYFKQKNLIYDHVEKEANKFIKEKTGRDLNDFKK